MTAVRYESIEIREEHDPLVDVSGYDFVLEPVYFRKGFSPDEKMFLRKSVAEKLATIQEELKFYKFKIWDGYRPRAVQYVIYQSFWKELHEKYPEWDEAKLKSEVEVFVTDAKNPARIPPHSTGGAVDLTLVDKDGKELDMGTEFDHFGPQAAPFYFDEIQQSFISDSFVILANAGIQEIPNQVRDDNVKIANNRKLLREAMSAAGFRYDQDEWWHFDYGNQIWATDLNHPHAIFGEVEDGILRT